MRNCRFILAAVLAFLPAAASGQDTVRDSVAIAELARHVTADAPTDSARVRALYEWVARNVSYDVEAYLGGYLRESEMRPEAVFRSRLTVCDGYSNLFVRMARDVGVEAVQIRGYAKGFDHAPGRKYRDTNHAWVAVRLDDEWQLADPTWGSGFVDGREFRPEFSWKYFLIEPEGLILDHFPEERRWQLLDRTMSKRAWERMATVPRQLIGIGLAHEVLREIASSRDAQLPTAYAGLDGAWIRKAPASGWITSGQQQAFDIEFPGAVEAALIQGDVWTHLQAVGDGRFAGGVNPEPGMLKVAVRRGGADEQYWVLLEYEVR